MITIQTALPMFKLFSSKTGTHAVNQHNFVLRILTICSLKPTDILLEPHIDNISPFRVYPKTIVTRTCSILPPSLKTKKRSSIFHIQKIAKQKKHVQRCKDRPKTIDTIHLYGTLYDIDFPHLGLSPHMWRKKTAHQHPSDID